MSMENNTPFRPVNNDRMAAFTAFRPAPQATPTAPVEKVNAVAEGTAAVALPTTPAPKPSRIDDAKADTILGAMQQEDQNDMLNVHSGLDADRVARLLNLLG